MASRPSLPSPRGSPVPGTGRTVKSCALFVHGGRVVHRLTDLRSMASHLYLIPPGSGRLEAWLLTFCPGSWSILPSASGSRPSAVTRSGCH